MFGIIDLIYQPMQKVDPPGIGTRQISNQFLMGRWVLERIHRDDVKKALGLGFQIRGRNAPGVLLGLAGVDDGPAHQPGWVDALPSGSAMPLRMESRIPGIETRYSVS